MGFFSRPRAEAANRPTSTINNRRQPTPETVGGVNRSLRLYAEAVRRISSEPVALQRGVPIGDGLGMKQLVAHVEPMFAREPSLVMWTAIRSAVCALYYQSVADDNGTPFVAVERAMGVGHVGDIAAGDDTIGVSPEWQSKLSAEQAQGAIGVYAAFAMRIFEYGRLTKLTDTDLIGHPLCCFSKSVGLDLIAWSVVAMLRLDCGENILQVPEPDSLGVPGWYTDPVYAKMERYWDGSDWTERCRALRGSGYVDQVAPLR